MNYELVDLLTAMKYSESSALREQFSDFLIFIL